MILFLGACKKCNTEILVKFPDDHKELIMLDLLCPYCIWDIKLAEKEKQYIYLHKKGLQK